jgi:hypothetical protein
VLRIVVWSGWSFWIAQLALEGFRSLEVWSTSRGQRNKLAHALNGNSAAPGAGPYDRPAPADQHRDEYALLTARENRARALRRRPFCHRRGGCDIPQAPLVWDPPPAPARPLNPIGWWPWRGRGGPSPPCSCV